MALIESDAALRDLLLRAKAIAVLGTEAGESNDAYRVPRSMQAAGRRIPPVRRPR